MLEQNPNRMKASLGALAASALCAAAVLIPGGEASASPQGGQTTQVSQVNHTPAAATSYALGVYAGPANVAGIRTFAAGSRRPVTYAMDFFNGTSWSTMDHPQSILVCVVR